MSDLKLLRQMRLERDNYSDPLEVLKMTKPMIRSGKILSVGDDSWDIYEQTLIAALEVSDDALALECLARLSDKFPQSGRVHALRGMMLEATQDPQEAIKFYEKVLKTEPTNVPIIKRRIAFAKSLGRVGEAVKLLAEYLDIYYSDADAWAELADLYTELSLFDNASFCWSEVVLLKPHDHVSHASYADSLYAQSLDQLNSQLIYIALKEYLRSIELCEDYLRGFCGVKVCCNAILSRDPVNPKDNKALSRSNGADQSRTSDVAISTEKVKALDLMSLTVLNRLEKAQQSLNDQPSVVKDFLRTLTSGNQRVLK